MKKLAALAAVAVVAVAFCALNAENRPGATSKPAADDAKALAVKAVALLAKCQTCHTHGLKGSDGKQVNLTDVPRLIQGGLIVPGKPEQSKLAKFVAAHPNPKHKIAAEKLPTQDEAKAFVAWIVAGAVDPNAPAATASSKPARK